MRADWTAPRVGSWVCPDQVGALSGPTSKKIVGIPSKSTPYHLLIGKHGNYGPLTKALLSFFQPSPARCGGVPEIGPAKAGQFF